MSTFVGPSSSHLHRSLAKGGLRHDAANCATQRKAVAIALLYIAIVVVAAIFAPWLAPFDPTQQFFDGLTLEGAPVTKSCWAGSRLTLTAHLVTYIIGIVSNGIAVIIGTLVGITAGFVRGWIGSLLMRLTDLMMAFPALLLAVTRQPRPDG